MPWLVAGALLVVVIVVASGLAEERELLRVLAHAEPAWLALAAVLQVGTYLCEGENWRVVMRAGGAPVPIMATWRLALAKLFVDQALPSAGISGTVVIARGLERQGVPRPVVMAGVVIDTTSYYFAYIAALIVAVAIVVSQGHATPLVIALALLIALVGLAITAAVLAVVRRGPPVVSGVLARIPLVRDGLRLIAEADRALSHRARLHALATLWQLGTVVLDALTMWLLLRAVGAPTPLPLVFASFMVSTLLRTVSIVPAGIGPFEAASTAALTLSGAPVTAALSATLLFRLLSFWLPLVPGLVFARAATRATTRQDAPPDMAWALPIDQIMAHVGSSPRGLTTVEAAARRARIGDNRLHAKPASSAGRVLWSQIASPLQLLLVFAAVTSLVSREWVDAGIILGIVGVSVGIGFSREYAAQRAVAALLERVHVRARVVRDGLDASVPVAELVPGDVVVLSAGNLVPADVVLLEATGLYVNEAMLTGESFPVDKRAGPLPPDTPPEARANLAWLGSNVRGGTARALVVATGRATRFGDIAHRLALRPPETAFERGVRRFGHLLTIAMLVMVIFVFTVNTLLGRPPIDTLLFSIALAVGLSPELLPMILSVSLARGARSMSRHGVIVKRLSAIENLGSMDVLCTDKTGTLTEGLVHLTGAWDPSGAPADAVLATAAINARLQAGLASPLDEAIVAAHPAPLPGGVDKLGEVPYDFVRKRLSVVVRDAREAAPRVRLITKGAFAHVLEVCDRVADAPLDDPTRAALEARFEAWSRDGVRVLAVAERDLAPDEAWGREAEAGLRFVGFLGFADPPKAGVGDTLAALAGLGVRVKLITGDARLVAEHVAREVGMPPGRVLTGRELDEMHDEALVRAAADASLFVEVDPNQKERIIAAIKKAGHVVGFLGDGVNDAPAMHASDASLAVEDAVDVAREAADLVLLEQDLDVIRLGIEEGRRTHANTLKYVLTTTSANLGNMVSMALASAFLPFLPLLAGQVLLNNFLSDIPAIGIAGDRVDRELVERPRSWDLRFILRFMLQFGLVSSLFDLITFGALIGLFAAGAELFRTGWFVESLLTELVIALVVRTRGPFYRSRPGRFLLAGTLAVIVFALLVPYLPGADLFGFVPLPAGIVLFIVGLTALYVVATEALKARFYRQYG
ncbi:MAG: magnesium-translocating P-type ATPase [Deltaproteobacteria bacterium]|nr:magnesium-translocating P-type ATPase [Deltaproteobacteria bacterium]